MRETIKLYIEKKTTKGGKDVFYIKERSSESLEPVIICLCPSKEIAQKILIALQGGPRRPVKP
jgi:hypothetical protein